MIIYRESKVSRFFLFCFFFALKTSKKNVVFLKMHANICEVSKHLQEEEEKKKIQQQQIPTRRMGDVP